MAREARPVSADRRANRDVRDASGNCINATCVCAPGWAGAACSSQVAVCVANGGAVTRLPGRDIAPGRRKCDVANSDDKGDVDDRPAGRSARRPASRPAWTSGRTAGRTSGWTRRRERP